MTLADTIKTLKTSAMLLPTEDRAIRLTGIDAKLWLQGQITQDIRNLSASNPIHGCLCNPKGQIQTILNIYESDSNLIIITEHPQILIDRIDQFVIMEDVTATLLDEPIISIQGANATGQFARDRSGFGGFDSFASPSLPPLNPEHLPALEITAGIPRFGQEIGKKTLPPELGPAFEAQHISYTKGCYVGQEVIHRIHARGHTNKSWVALTGTEPFTDSQVKAQDQSIGIVHRSAPHPEFGYIASATIKNAFIEPGTTVSVGNANYTVAEMPLLR